MQKYLNTENFPIYGMVYKSLAHLHVVQGRTHPSGKQTQTKSDNGSIKKAKVCEQSGSFYMQVGNRLYVLHTELTVQCVYK